MLAACQGRFFVCQKAPEREDCVNLFSLLKDSLHILRSNDYKVVSSEELQKRSEENARGVCAAFSRGNVSLTRGEFVTPQEQEEARKNFLSYKF